MNYKSILTLILIAGCSGTDRTEGPCSPVGTHALTFTYPDDDCVLPGASEPVSVRVTQSGEDYSLHMDDGEPVSAFFLQEQCALIASDIGIELELDFSGDKIDGWGEFDILCLQEFTITED